MSYPSPKRLLDSSLSEYPPKNGKLGDRELIDTLFEKPTHRVIKTPQHSMSQQFESGKYNSWLANQSFDNFNNMQTNGFSFQDLDTTQPVSVLKTPTRSRQNTHRSRNLSVSFDLPPKEESPEKKALKMIAASSISQILKFALLRFINSGFKHIQEESIRERINQHWEGVMATGGPQPNQFMSIKIKARIIWALYRNRPKLTINSAFYRWKVLADPILVKEVVDRFALYSKINMTVALWRMKSILTSRSKEEAMRRRLLRQRKATKILQAILNKIVFRNLTVGFGGIKEYIYLMKFMKQLLDNISKNFRMTKQQAFDRWLYSSNKLTEEEQRKRLIRVLGCSVDLVKKAFNKWRNETIFERLRKIKTGGVGAPKIYRILNDILRRNLKGAFDAMAEDYLLHKGDMEWQNRNAKNYKKGIKLMELLLNSLEKRQLKYALMMLKDSVSEEQYSKMKVVQRLIFRNNLRMRDALKIWKNACVLGNIIRTNNLTRNLFNIASGSLASNTALLFKIEKENKKKSALKLLVYSTNNKLLQALLTWRANCNVKHITSQHERLRNATYLAFLLEKLLHSRYVDGLKEISRFVVERKTKKMQSAVKILMNSSSFLKHYLRVWYFRTRELTNMERTTQVSQLMEIINKVLANNTKPIFNLPKELESKRQSLKWIFNHFDNLKKRAFYRWAVKSLKRRLHSEMNLRLKFTKTDQLAFKLEFMYLNVMKDAFASIYQIIRERKLRARAIICMQKSVFDRLKVAFLTWKNFNSRVKDENTRQIVFALRDLRWKHLLWGFSGIRSEHLRKNNLMRRALKNMELCSISSTKFYFYKWVKATEMLRLFSKLQTAVKLFQLVNSGLKTHVEAVLMRTNVREKKEEAFSKLFLNYQTRINEAFYLWHDRARMLKNLSGMRQELKAQLLNKLVIIHTKCTLNDMKYYFNKWLGKSKKDVLKRRVINRFLNTTFGLKLLAFQRWKAMCNKAELRKNQSASTIQRVLLSLHRKLLQAGFYPIQELWYEVNDKKLKVARKLISLAKSDVRTYFNLWATNTRNLRHIHTCKKIVSLFNTTQEALKLQLLPFLNVNPVAKKKKENALRFFTRKFNGRLRYGFNLWHELAKQKTAILAKKASNSRVLFKGVGSAKEKLEAHLLREAFYLLKRFESAESIKRRFFVSMLKTQFGRLQSAFNHWKCLPKPEDPSKKRAIGALAYQLNKIYDGAMKKGFDALKDTWHEKNEKKRNAIRQLIKVTQGELQAAFNRWHNTARALMHMMLSRQVIRLFETVNYGVRGHLAAVILTDKKKEKKSRLLYKMDRNLRLLMHDALLRWKEKAWLKKTIEKSQGDKKLNAAAMIFEWTDERRVATLRQGFNNFQKYDTQKKHIKTMLLGLLRTQNGLLYQAFERWKRAPTKKSTRTQTKSQALVLTIRKIMNAKIRNAFDKLREELIAKQELKKAMIKKLIWVGKGKLRQYFERWAMCARADEKVQIIKASQKIVDIMRAYLKGEICQFAGNIVLSDRKKGATQLLARAFLSKYLGHFFHRWYIVTKMTAIHTQSKLPNLWKLIEKNRQAVLKQAFELLKAKNSKVLTRGFVSAINKFLLAIKREAFSAIQKKSRLELQRKQMFAVNKMLRYMKLYQSAALYTHFTTWRNNTLNYNPWFKRSMEIIAKGSRIQYQIAFWRLRDSVTADGTHIDSKHYHAVKKIVRYITKRYESTLSRAFMQISSYSIEKFTLNMSGILGSDFQRDRAPSSAKSSISKKMRFDFVSGGNDSILEELDKQRIEKQRLVVLRLVIKNYLLRSFDPQERVKEAFVQWKLIAGNGKTAVLPSLQKKMDKHELAYLAKLGSLELIKQRIELPLIKMKKSAFEAIARSAGIYLKDSSRITSVEYTPDKTYDSNRLGSPREDLEEIPMSTLEIVKKDQLGNLTSNGMNGH